MRVAYLGSREAVGFVVDRGFGALPPDEVLVLREATPAGLACPNGGAVAVLDVPIDLLSRFEETTAGEPRAFEVPPSVAEPFPVLAYRGVGPRRRTWGRGAVASPSLPRLAAGLAALVVVGAIAAGALTLGGENAGSTEGAGSTEDAERVSEAEPPRGAPGDAPRAEGQAPSAASKTDGAKTDGAKRSRRESRRRAQRQAGGARAGGPPSRAVGTPTAGRLVNGVALPARGRNFFTVNIPAAKSPNERFRRFATRAVIDRTRRVIAAYARAHPNAPRVGVGDLSLPRGGEFGTRFGGTGHVAHQNGLEVDILYPRKDGRERLVESPDQVDRALAQDLLDRFVRAGADLVSLDPQIGLRGPSGVVEPREFHEEHLHVRFPKRR